MKKTALLLFTLTLLFSLKMPAVHAEEVEGSTTDDSEGEYEYDPLIIDSDYDRIYKEDGLWYGVIEVENRRIFNVDSVLSSPVAFSADIHLYHYFVEFSFSRDTEYLKEIIIYYEIDGYCPYLMCLWGGEVEDYSETVTLTYDPNSISLEEAKTIKEVFGEGAITFSIDPDYDYVLNLNHTTSKDVDSFVEIIQFTYVLTDYETTDLRLDIQDQYEQELAIIVNNEFLTIDEMEQQILDLQEEYAEFDVVFGEEITSPCIGDSCTIDYDGEDDENAVIDFLENALEGFIELIKTIVIGAIALIASGLIAIALAKALLDLSVELIIKAIKEGTKRFFELVIYFSKHIKQSLYFFISTVLSAFDIKI